VKGVAGYTALMNFASLPLDIPGISALREGRGWLHDVDELCFVTARYSGHFGTP
jgi:hypothetical protein